MEDVNQEKVLPQQTSPKEPGLASAEKPKKMLNVVIVDDEPDIRELAQIYVESSPLENIGQILTAANGMEAWKIIEENGSINVVLTDGEMPKMDGLELRKKIKEAGKDITVGLVSGGVKGLNLSDQAVRESVMSEYDLAAVLPKPFDSEGFSKFFSQINNVVQTAGKK